MTNKEDTDGDSTCDPRLAAFLAVHFVREILDDAYVIANSALESGQPWRYQSFVRNAKPCETDDEDASSKDECDVVNENKMELAANIVATSTPQKVTDDFLKCKVDPFLGQGDEAQELHQNDLSESTSMFINHLFDMSEVERVIVSDVSEDVQSNLESNELLTQAMAKIMDSYINTALGIALEQPTESVDSAVPIGRSSSTEHSEYSFLSDAFVTDIGKDIAFYIHDVDDAIECEVPHVVPAVQITEINEENVNECMEKIDVTRFENAYLSLNHCPSEVPVIPVVEYRLNLNGRKRQLMFIRYILLGDYEQCSEDDGNVILDDPKGMTLQEVELLTANTSNEELSGHDDTEPDTKCVKSKALTATSGVSAASKKSLVSRCRSQGAKLLACLRGWWRRRTPGNRKEHQHRISGAVRGLCPLSPDARRRAASLIDQRVVRSPSPSLAAVWKFNTVNEALVHSSRWKDYTFDVKPDECGEY